MGGLNKKAEKSESATETESEPLDDCEANLEGGWKLKNKVDAKNC